MLVFTTVSHQHASQLRSGVDLGLLPGCAATPALLSALGSDASTEEAEFAALSNAGVQALTRSAGPARLVLAADVAHTQVVDRHSDEGEVEVRGLRWSQVQALFADEPEAGEAVARARGAVTGTELVDAVAEPAVTDLLRSFDLLWYSVDELEDLA